MNELIFFVALPYLALLFFVGGSIYRAFTGFKTAHRAKPTWSVRGDMAWTTRSTGFFGRASIGPASLCLHWGLILLLVAHVVGLIGGAMGWAGWVDFFRWVGMASGVLVLYGGVWAFVRRLINAQVRAMSTVEDFLVLLFLILITGLGLYHAVVLMAWGVSYGAGAWLASILFLRPDPSLMAGAPLTMKLHVVVALIFFAWFPFTKLVHAFSYPFAFACGRAPISVRSYLALKR